MTDQTLKDIDRAFKALKERDELLNKIRVKIADMPKLYPFIDHIDAYVKCDDVLALIDKYRNEVEK